MSRTAHKLLAGSGGKDAYEIESSLMFNKPDDPYLVRTPSSNGNRDVWTFSCWYKPCVTSYAGYIFTQKNDSTSSFNDPLFYIYHDAGILVIYHGLPGANYYYKTNQVLRDVAAWYHIVLAWDTTQATGSNRVKLWMNGEAVTSWHTYNDWPQNTDTILNGTDTNNVFGAAYGQNSAGEISGEQIGYIAEAYLLDGTAKVATDFAETDSATGQWIPKETEFTSSEYGTNGFYLPFKKNDRYSPYFDGSASSGIQTADHADFAVGSGSFTYECWAYGDEDQGVYRELFGQADSSGSQASIGISLQINTSNQPVGMLFYNDGAANAHIVMTSSTAMVDNKWNHIAFVRNGTSLVLYLNGTSVATATSSESANDGVTCKFAVGRLGESASNTFKGWISNFRFVKGTAVYTGNFTPSTSPLTAITNTKLLCCQDSTATTDNSGTSKTLTLTAANTYTQQMSPFTYDWYQDHSGKDSHFQADNITVNNVMLDTPTNNFNTLNPLNKGSYVDLVQGNLTCKGNTDADAGWAHSTMAMTSGKWYAESRIDTVSNWAPTAISISDIISSGPNNLTSALYANYASGARQAGASEEYGSTFTEQSGMDTGSALSAGAIISCAVDMDNKKLFFAIDGTYLGSGNPATGANPTFTWSIDTEMVFSTQQAFASPSQSTYNFGQNGTFCGGTTAGGNADGNGYGDFKYSVPSGFLALCTKNLPTPAIKKSTEHFNTVLWTGNGASTRSITGVGFQPDFTWTKSRTDAYSHLLYDSVRGAGVSKGLKSNNNAAEGENDNSTYGYLSAFASDGFNLVHGSDALSFMNEMNENMVAWSWKAGNSSASNEDGSINTTATSVSTDAGFSVSTYTGTGSTATVGHGLGVAPSVIIIKNRSQADDWAVYSRGDATDYLELNTHSYSPLGSTDDNTYWNDTAPTSSVFTIGTAHSVNASSETYVAYCFANVEGFFKSGTYTGNGAAEDGPYVYTGFSPAFVIQKETSEAGGSWFMWDSKREVGNVKDAVVWVDYPGAETSHAEYEIDFLSTGFKIRGNSGGTNSSGQTNLYMAWAEAPFKYANAR